LPLNDKCFHGIFFLFRLCWIRAVISSPSTLPRLLFRRDVVVVVVVGSKLTFCRPLDWVVFVELLYSLPFAWRWEEEEGRRKGGL